MAGLIIRNDDISYYTDLSKLVKVLELTEHFRQTVGLIPMHRPDGTGRNYPCWRSEAKWFSENADISKLLHSNTVSTGLHGITHECVGEGFEFEGFYPEMIPGFENTIQSLKDEMPQALEVFIPPHNSLSSEWLPTLSAQGLRIVSGTKRQIVEHIGAAPEDAQWMAEAQKKVKAGYAPCGVIKHGILAEIPQTVMVKRTNFYKQENYFKWLLSVVEEVISRCEAVVLTIHWWDFFLKDGSLDFDFSTGFENFTRTLAGQGIESWSFEDALKKGREAWLPHKLFEPNH